MSEFPKRAGISDILYDEKFRAWVIQFVVIMGTVGLFAWMTSNAIENLAELGITQGFGFLDRTSFYDINQALIEYSSTSTHGRAALVGLLNTLLMACAGIVAATLLGFFVGVARLSSNWLLSKVASFYVETLRNIPLLIQIVLWQSVILTLPSVKNSIDFGGIVYLSNRGTVIPEIEAGEGFVWVLLSFFVGICVCVYNMRRSKKHQLETGEVRSYFWVNVASVTLFPLGVYFLLGSPLDYTLPELSRFNFKGGVTIRTEFVSLWLALSIYTSSFIAENVRGGILAISKGQTEASLALGLTRGQLMRLVIIPQAMRVVITPLTSQYLNLTKNSSLAIAVGYMDLTATLGGITLNQTGQAMECMFLLLLFYLSISLTVSLLMNWFNVKMALVER